MLIVVQVNGTNEEENVRLDAVVPLGEVSQRVMTIAKATPPNKSPTTEQRRAVQDRRFELWPLIGSRFSCAELIASLPMRFRTMRRSPDSIPRHLIYSTSFSACWTLSQCHRNPERGFLLPSMSHRWLTCCWSVDHSFPLDIDCKQWM